MMVEIIVNGRPILVKDKVLTVDRVVELAKLDPGFLYAINYRGALAPLQSGTLAGGATVEIRNGTVIDARNKT